MKIHIIEEYIEIRHNVRKIECQSNKLAEEEAEYTYLNNSNDKIMRQILKDKNQVAINLNEWLKIKDENKIKPEELEEVTESYITKTWSNEETDILYKDKKYEGVYYLIEHQTKIDYQMAKRIAEYKNEIQNHYQRNEKIRNNKNYKIANITAIVLYSGDKKWDAKKRFEEMQIINPRLRKNVTKEKEYEVISMDDYTLQELREKVEQNDINIITKIEYIRKVSKIKETEKLIQELKKIKIKKEEINYIASYIVKRINIECGKEKAKLMIKNIEKEYEEEEDDMLDEFVDRLLYEGRKEGKKEGRKEGKAQALIDVAINMLKEKCDKKIIKKCTGLSESKINQLEKSLQES